MSSTLRGYNRHKSDYYITPVNEIEKFIEAIRQVEPQLFRHDRTILDPCAGGDINNLCSYPMAINNKIDYCRQIITVDIREDSRAGIICDYLDFNPIKKPDIIITNPPFSIALDIIKKALEDVKGNGYVIMLLRLNFFGSKDRNEWLMQNMPKHCFVHAKRMSFTKDKKTDSIEYAHFVWQKGLERDFTLTHLLKY